MAGNHVLAQVLVHVTTHDVRLASVTRIIFIPSLGSSLSFHSNRRTSLVTGKDVDEGRVCQSFKQHAGVKGTAKVACAATRRSV